MALRFTVGTNYLESTENEPNVNANYTCMAWLRILDSPSGTSVTVLEHHCTTFQTSHDQITLGDSGFGLGLGADFYNENTGVSLIEPGLSDNVWYHVATVREGTAVRLYINGVLEGSDTNSTAGRGVPDRMTFLQVGRWWACEQGRY